VKPAVIRPCLYQRFGIAEAKLPTIMAQSYLLALDKD